VSTKPSSAPVKTSAAISRRAFLATSAAAGGALVVGLTLRGRLHHLSSDTSQDPFNAWIRIHPDGQTQLVLNKSEMGQGVFTALPMILAEEAEIDFSRITVIQADNADGTGGSGSVWEGYRPLRQAGAQVRETMIAAAARRWRVPAAECRARDSQVTHTPTGRTLSYAALVKDARRLPLPYHNTVRLKDPKDFTLLGRSIPHLDIPDKVKGVARFGLDVRLPGMVYAVVAQCPYFRGDLLRYDATRAKAIRGVLEVFDIPTDPNSANKNSREIAVVASNTWAAIQGRNALGIEWRPGQYHDESSESLTAQLRAGLDAQEYWNSTNTTVNPDTVPAAKRIESVYEFPFLAHANMEPMNITIRLEDGRCEIWSPTQDGEDTQGTAAKILGLNKDDVTVHVTFVGGGLGRRFGSPFDHQAVQIGRRIQRPVQLVWTREDDFTHDRYRPAVMHRTLGAAVVTALLFGMLPAFRAAGLEFTPALKDGRGSSSSTTRGALARSLIVGQIALSVVLLALAGLFVRSLINLSNVETGFDKHNVLIFSLDSSTANLPRGTPEEIRSVQLQEQIEDRVQNIPGVKADGFAFFTFNQGGWTDEVLFQGIPRTQSNGGEVFFNITGKGYFSTMGIQLIAGRLFNAQDTQMSNKVAVVNETMARRFFPNGSAIGRRFGIGETPDHPGEKEVIGVVKDAKYSSLTEGTLMAAYFPCTQNPGFYGNFAVRYAPGANRQEIISRTRHAIAEVNSNILVNSVGSLEEQVDGSIATHSLIARLSSFFGIIAVFLGCIGIYGLLSYSVARRTSEFGVRLALGARSHMLLWMILRECILLLALGLAIGVPVALSSTRILKSQLYELSPLDPTAISIAIAAVSVMTIAAAWLPARRATKIDPMQALRTE
jgi:ABC-type antimicrobial peptide transport system permease subunit